MQKHSHQKPFTYALAAAAAYMLSVREGEDGGGNAPPEVLTLSPADLQKKIEEAVNAQVAGLKAKNQELLGTVHSLKEKAKDFENLDPAELRALKDRLDNDEDTKLLSEGKKQQVIEKYTERMRAEHAAQLAAKEEALKAEQARADSYKQAVLDAQILAVTTGLHKGAVEDALLYARNVFTLDPKGKAVQVGPDGTPILGKDGATPFGPAEWIEMQKELKPHWFPATTSGGGSGGAREAGGNGQTMKREVFDRLSPADKAAAATKGLKIID